MNNIFNINKVLLALKEGKKPDNTIIYNGDEPEYIVANSKRNDVTIVKMMSKNLYKAIRVKSKMKSKNTKIRESIGRPKKPNMNSNEFDQFEYQLTHFESKSVSDIQIPNSIHQYCHWNSKPATSIRTANNVRRIKTDWVDYSAYKE